MKHLWCVVIKLLYIYTNHLNDFVTIKQRWKNIFLSQIAYYNLKVNHKEISISK